MVSFVPIELIVSHAGVLASLPPNSDLSVLITIKLHWARLAWTRLDPRFRAILTNTRLTQSRIILSLHLTVDHVSEPQIVRMGHKLADRHSTLCLLGVETTLV